MYDKGNCFPSGKCPSSFGRHDNDESGKCFPNHPPFNNCPPEFKFKCIPHPIPIFRPIIHPIIEIHKTIHSSSGGSSSSLSKGCFDAIKIAWLGKVHRGQNSEADNFIDNCLGVR